MTSVVCTFCGSSGLHTTEECLHQSSVIPTSGQNVSTKEHSATLPAKEELALPQVQTRSRRDRFRGALAGVAMGDCLGADFEFRTTMSLDGSNILEPDEVLRHTNPDRFRPGQRLKYTDDTAMTFSLAESLIQHNGFDGGDIAQRFYEQHDREPFRGYGPSIGNVFAGLRDLHRHGRLCEQWKVPAAAQFAGAGSYGNGGAMRSAPTALAGFGDISLVQELARQQSIITHAHPHAVTGAVLQATAVHFALEASTDSKFDAKSFAASLLETAKALEADQTGPFTPKCLTLTELLDDDVPPEVVAAKLGNGVEASESVPVALYAAGAWMNLGPQVVIERAICLGGDTDTIAAMAGAVAGAFWGLSAFPPEWQNCCEGVNRAAQAGDSLHSRLGKH